MRADQRFFRCGGRGNGNLKTLQHCRIIETANQRYWRDYFLTGEAQPGAPEYIKKASQIIELANLSEEERKVSAILEKARADMDAETSSFYHNGIEKGMEKGIEKGEAQKAVAIAKAMLGDGDTPEKIIRCTGLSLEQIKNINT